jgi:hypothetical protein
MVASHVMQVLGSILDTLINNKINLVLFETTLTHRVFIQINMYVAICHSIVV